MSRSVHVVVPGAIDDPTRPSGGNVYDRRLCAELDRLGWSVHLDAVPGAWPSPDPADLTALDEALASVPPGMAALVDGLVASAAPVVITRYARSLRLVVLVHQPLGVVSADRRESEAAMLRAVSAVVTTSGWTRQWLLDQYDVPADRAFVAVPGADPAGTATGTDAGGALLCVGAVTPGKGQDVLVDALADIEELPWHCTVVGSLDVDPAFVRRLGARVEDGLAGRVQLTGPLLGTDLDAAYLGADVLVLPSRAETYGMVITEALAHGLPVIAAAIGGTTEALGRSAAGVVPGLTVPPADPAALSQALRAWLGDPGLRAGAREAAEDRRHGLPTWSDTAARVAAVLTG